MRDKWYGDQLGQYLLVWMIVHSTMRVIILSGEKQEESFDKILSLVINNI